MGLKISHVPDFRTEGRHFHKYINRLISLNHFVHCVCVLQELSLVPKWST
jgi:hypothetical protein